MLFKQTNENKYINPMEICWVNFLSKAKVEACIILLAQRPSFELVYFYLDYVLKLQHDYLM